MIGPGSDRLGGFCVPVPGVGPDMGNHGHGQEGADRELGCKPGGQGVCWFLPPVPDGIRHADQSLHEQGVRGERRAAAEGQLV